MYMYMYMLYVHTYMYNVYMHVYSIYMYLSVIKVKHILIFSEFGNWKQNR